MCGISGVIIKKNASSLSERLVRMTNVIKHRGPDDEGYVIIDHNNIANCFGGDETKVYQNNSQIQYLPSTNINEQFLDNRTKIALGFRRLSILDLSPTGHQPMSSKNGRYWIVFNGEIYNYLELKSELIKAGYSFISNSDTEVIMAAYDYWGTDCQNKFNGMWAFILLDLNNNEIIVSRDRFGIKPLYYYSDENVILFASEIKQFLAFGGLDIGPNIEKIKTDLLFDTREYLKETSFTNVYRFPKSQYLKINIKTNSVNNFNFIKYYNLTFSNDGNHNKYDSIKAKNLSEEYYNLLEDAVSLRLRSDVEIGTCFSGGLDSSSVVYFVNKLLKKNNNHEKQKTFSLVFNSPDTSYCDESIFIDSLSNQLKLNSFKFEPKLQDVISNYENMVFAMDTPQHSTLMSYLFTYKLVKDNNVTVTLDGQGADELQAGYIPYFRYYFMNNAFGDIFNKFSKNLNIMEGSNKEILRGAFFSVLNNLGFKEFSEKILSKRKLQSPFKILNEKLFEDFNGDLQTLFHYGDRGSMINSVESRFPMMDFRLVEFWMNLPSIYKIHNGYTKYIARLAMNNELPNTVVWRKDKKGWEMPQKEWIKSGLDIIMKKEIDNSVFLKDIGINFSFDNFDKNKSDHRYWKMPIKLYNLSLWHKLFFQHFEIRK